MIEALWSVEFVANDGGGGTGIAVFETGRVLGGDSMMTYIGDYKVEGGVVSAEVKVDKYANAPGMVSVVGIDHFILVLSGRLDPKQMTLTGYVKGHPEMQMGIRVTRRAELP